MLLSVLFSLRSVPQMEHHETLDSGRLFPINNELVVEFRHRLMDAGPIIRSCLG